MEFRPLAVFINGNGLENGAECVITNTYVEPEPEPEGDPDPFIGSRSGDFINPPTPAVQGEVLGEVTEEDCGLYLYEYIKYGASNNPVEVRKLQTFLNLYMGENLEVTGFYGLNSLEAVNRFQLVYKEQILRPWVEEGLHDDENVPTGYVYKTTKRWINLMVCPSLALLMPDFSEDRMSLGLMPGAVLGEETEQPEGEPEEGFELTEDLEETEELLDEPLEEDVEEEEEEKSGFPTIAALLAALLVIGLLAFYFLRQPKKI